MCVVLIIGTNNIVKVQQSYDHKTMATQYSTVIILEINHVQVHTLVSMIHQIYDLLLQFTCIMIPSYIMPMSTIAVSFIFLSSLFPVTSKSIVYQHIVRNKSIVLEDTSILDHLNGNSNNVSGVVKTTVFTSFELKAKSSEHAGYVATSRLVEAREEFSYVNPLDGVCWKRNS